MTPSAPIIYYEDTDIIEDSKNWKSTFTLKLLKAYEEIRMQNKKYSEGKHE